jgi:hypothetical protein
MQTASMLLRRKLQVRRAALSSGETTLAHGTLPVLEEATRRLLSYSGPMRGAMAVLVFGLVAIGSGCSRDEPEPPSVAEAERAIRLQSRSNLATGPARSIECTSDDGVTTCAVDYEQSCAVLSVTRKAGRLVIAEAADGICSHLSTASMRLTYSLP